MAETILTIEQIKNRLKSLDMYESSVMFSMPDEGDYTTRELMKILVARGKLQGLLQEAMAKARGLDQGTESVAHGTETVTRTEPKP